MKDEPIKLSSQLGRYSDTVALYPDRLAYSWKRGADTGQCVVPLAKLAPTLASASGRPPKALRRLRLGLAVLVLAGVIYWSVIHNAVPLLAPVLALVGFGLVVSQIQHLQVRRWTVICHRDGRMYIYLRHDACDEAERKRFEEAYAEAFKTASPGPPG